MPVFDKRRFQHGATAGDQHRQLFPASEAAYRRAFEQAFVP
jgi:asparagine synthase (glutamine-hydrolysing)